MAETLRTCVERPAALPNSRWIALVGVVLTSVGLPPSGANAEVEPPALHDARSYSMGGTGVALIDSGAAVYHNAANMMFIDEAAVTLSFSPSFNSTTQPIALNPMDPSTIQSFETESSIAPLSFIGGGLRIHERVVLGLGAYLFAGTGGTIKNFPGLMGEDLELLIGLGEVQLPVSVQLTDNLAISAGLRMSFGFFKSAQFTPDGIAQQDFTGLGFPGVHVGVAYQPIPELRLGLNYRSQIRTTFSGDVTTRMGVLDGELDLDLPHQLRIGAALSLVDEKLTLALDLRASFYEHSSDILTSRITAMGMTQEAALPLNWQNTYDLFLGAEYRVIPELALRAGWAAGNSSVPGRSAAPLFPAPGFLQSITLGAGTYVGDFELGVGGSYSFSSENITETPSTGGFPGEYSSRIWGFSVSATYRHSSK